MSCRANAVATGTFCGAKRCKGGQGTGSSSQSNLDDFKRPTSEIYTSQNSAANRTTNFSQNDLDKFTKGKAQDKNLNRSAIINESLLETPKFNFQQKNRIFTNDNNLENLASSAFKLKDQSSAETSQNNSEDFTKNATGRLVIDLQESAASSEVPTRRNINMSESTILNTLRSVRTPIVNYQEARGVPKDEQISFINLITSLCTHAYTAAITILVMLWNLAPLLDGFVYFARFAVDKLIEIFETEDQKEKIMKMAVFAGEIIIIFFLIFLIVGLIFMPVYVLTARIISKVWGMIAW